MTIPDPILYQELDKFKHKVNQKPYRIKTCILTYPISTTFFSSLPKSSNIY